MSKKLAIVGRHPVLEHGFNATMSITEALGFEAVGCNVTLFLPHSSVHDPKGLAITKGVGSLDNLSRFGGNFEIRILDDSSKLSQYDIIVWQTYRPEEHFILESLKSTSAIRTKIPPRLFTGEVVADRRKALGMLEHFDFVATSLMADERIVQECLPDLVDRFKYVPRGFNRDWLSGSERDSIPTIGLDRAVKADDQGRLASAHIVKTGLALKKYFPNTRFLSLRSSIPELGSERIPVLPFREFYSRFIGRLWIYMPIDFDHSVHVKGRKVDSRGQKVYIGLYENQIVEVQLSGGLVLARRDDIAAELIALPDVSLVDSYDDTEELLRRALDHISNFAFRSTVTQAWATGRHDHIAMATKWLRLLPSGTE
jgi:hypothetical protein